jgi:hypothetical protein
MTDEQRILTVYRLQALYRLSKANAALWHALPCQNGDNTIMVNLNTEYGATQSNSKEFSEFMRAAMSIGRAEGVVDAQVRCAADSRLPVTPPLRRGQTRPSAETRTFRIGGLFFQRILRFASKRDRGLRWVCHFTPTTIVGELPASSSPRHAGLSRTVCVQLLISHTDHETRLRESAAGGTCRSRRARHIP